MTWTEERHKAVRDRLVAATEGPWAAYGNGAHEVYCAVEFEDGDLGDYVASVIPKLRDADFIANSRTDLADALSEIERLQAELAGAWERGAEAAWKLTGEGWNAEYAGRELHLEKFRDINPNVLNPYRKEEQ